MNIVLVKGRLWSQKKKLRTTVLENSLFCHLKKSFQKSIQLKKPLHTPNTYNCSIHAKSNFDFSIMNLWTARITREVLSNSASPWATLPWFWRGTRTLLLTERTVSDVLQTFRLHKVPVHCFLSLTRCLSTCAQCWPVVKRAVGGGVEDREICSPVP